jgi:3-oxoacyl-[acyl-carrier protein] reductase
MELGIAGKVALVCGGSRGIAYEAAAQLAREGCQVAICGRDAASLAQAADRLHGLAGAPVLAVQADLATAEGIAAVVAAVTERHGGVDILVCNTGGPPTGGALSFDWEAWEGASRLLLRSVVALTQAFVPGMRARGWGRVLAITSLAVKRPQGNLVLSNTLRAGVTGFLRTLADEVAADGVTVNTVLPGFTATERLASLAEANAAKAGTTREAVYAGWTAETPAGRLGRPEEVAAVLTFLASVPAGFVTGQAILADGGAVRSLL